VELPGIEAAYNAVELHEQVTGQHDLNWLFTGIDEYLVELRQHQDVKVPPVPVRGAFRLWGCVDLY
jgi:hypothetical protein